MNTKTPFFPNGFDCWQETHFQIVSYMALNVENENSWVHEVNESRGTGGLYELALELTNEFEYKNQGRVWDGNFFDAIDDFLTDSSPIARQFKNCEQCIQCDWIVTDCTGEKIAITNYEMTVLVEGFQGGAEMLTLELPSSRTGKNDGWKTHLFDIENFNKELIMERRLITYKHKKYTIRQVDIKGLSYTVANDTLLENITNDEGDTIADKLYEGIAYFVPDNVLVEMNDADLAHYICTYIDSHIPDHTENIINL